jgi:hypothetical protein
MLEAFAAQSAQLAKSSADWSQLKDAAGGGQLRMEPNVAEQAAKRCEDMIETLDKRYQSAGQLSKSGQMGECLIGGALAQKFSDKAVGPENSFQSVITQHQAILKDMAQTYRQAAKSFAAQEQANVEALQQR